MWPLPSGRTSNLHADHCPTCDGKGCPNCFGRGYRGRTAVFEMLVLSRRMRSAIAKGMDREDLREILRQEGDYATLQENCRRLVQDGVTTIEEARRLGSSVEYDE